MIEGIIDMVRGGDPALAVIAGLAVGLVHAFEPDHIGAVSAMSHRAGVGLAARGVLWGMGHTLGIVAVGLLVAGLSLHITDGFFAGAEVVAGLVLVGLGAMAIRGSRRHSHPHRHPDGTVHTHPHDHAGGHRHGHRFYIIGCIHGVAGSGGLVALAASAMPGIDMVYFLALFGAGSIVGMAAASGLVGLPFALLSGTITKYLRYGVSLMAVAIGGGIVVSVLGGVG